jgi:hypothetical protein
VLYSSRWNGVRRNKITNSYFIGSVCCNTEWLRLHNKINYVSITILTNETFSRRILITFERNLREESEERGRDIASVSHLPGYCLYTAHSVWAVRTYSRTPFSYPSN